MGCTTCQKKKIAVETFKTDVNDLIERIKKARNVKTPKIKGIEDGKTKKD